jgi:hypothetical protein
MLRFLGGVSGMAIAVAVFGGSGSFGSPQAFSAGFDLAIGVSAVFRCWELSPGCGNPPGVQPALAQVRASA